jgi:hypothetical protein
MPWCFQLIEWVSQKTKLAKGWAFGLLLFAMAIVTVGE